MENNKVKVKIYGQEYVIAGEKTREEIIQVAAHVDMKMQEVTEAAKAAGVVPSNIAVLAAVNITSEYFQVLEEMEELKRMNIQLEKDAQHYVQLWDKWSRRSKASAKSWKTASSTSRWRISSLRRNWINTKIATVDSK